MKQRKVLIVASQFVFLVLLGLHALSAMSAESSCSESAQQYWKTFRNAVLQNDLSTIANLSRFPFEVRGILDESNKRKILRDEFQKLVPALLEADPGVSPTLTSMKSLLDTATCLSPSFCNAYGNQFRVGTWVFELTSEGWRFVQAFVSFRQACVTFAARYFKIGHSFNIRRMTDGSARSFTLPHPGRSPQTT